MKIFVISSHWIILVTLCVSSKAADPVAPIEKAGTKFYYSEAFLNDVSFKEVANSDEWFFTCTEHPDYPLGKPFGPYDSEADCRQNMAVHARQTGHSDMVIWSGKGAASADTKGFKEAKSRCFCVGDCVKDTGDSSHFRKTVDVECSLPIAEKKKKLLGEMVKHYLEAGHVEDISDLEKVFEDMRKNIVIRCYDSSAVALVSATELAEYKSLPALGKGKDAAKKSSERVQVYAGPDVFGPWHILSSHVGAVTYKLTVEPIGETVVVGEVRYYNADNRQTTTGFYKEIKITTGNSIANVEVRLKGIPTGGSCWVYVD